MYPLAGTAPVYQCDGLWNRKLWNALNNADFHNNIAYDRTDTQAKFTVTLAGVNGHVNTKKLDFIFEDIDGNMKFVCLHQPGLKRQYVPDLCSGFTSGGGGGGG